MDRFSHVDLAKPLKTLTDLLRQGGNLGAHFDENQEVDEQTALATLELIEYLLEYIFTLPELINTLEQRINQLNISSHPSP
ncbi:MAG: hypothetical protein HY774_27025 [Acidobacteria bacterium]|nr:hypothetical protein [Acidobacteriota bacterium]